VCLDRHNLELKIVKCEPENSNSIQAEHEHLQSEIKNLQAFKVNPNITINFKGLPTMVDGKVVSALTNKNTTQCTICDKSSSEMAKNVGPFTPVSQERL